MAIFNTKKKSAKEKTRPVRHAHAAKLAPSIAHDIIRAPWFSEKALIATERGVYTFAVPADATKAEIAAAIKEVYSVSPRAVRIVSLPGKRKMMRTKRGIGTRAARHKAYVYLNAGETIQFA